ncbi:MAG TPA: 1-(5-phosphoribosyl)-5-[(5-phosphoribosylamino)methylideneamino] imidazole-4-carboxamide isomerase [Gemmatimonadaceae bacterium]
MQVIPSIDLRDNACVQLVGGSYFHERVRIPNPVAVAKKWARLGFGGLHLIDLDAATGRGSNRQMITSILGALPTENHFRIQCGGGVRDLETITELLEAGASEVVVGTRAIEDRPWLETAVSRYPNRLVVAADARARKLVTRGWSETGSVNVIDFIDELAALPLAGILVTVVEREGRMEGPDLTLMQQIALRSRFPLQASGGVRGIGDLRGLAEQGVSATIVGMALYTGALDPQTIIEEFPA